MNNFSKITEELASTLSKKNAAYGDSYTNVGDFLRLLYPNGVKPEKYEDLTLIVRIFDKLKRIAASNDSYSEDPYLDIAGYGILGVSLSRQNADKSDSR